MMRPTYVRARVGSRRSGSSLSATTNVFFWARAGSAPRRSPRPRAAIANSGRRMRMKTAFIVRMVNPGTTVSWTADIIHLLRWARKGGSHDRAATFAGGSGQHGRGDRATGGRARPRRGARVLHRGPGG